MGVPKFWNAERLLVVVKTITDFISNVCEHTTTNCLQFGIEAVYNVHGKVNLFDKVV